MTYIEPPGDEPTVALSRAEWTTLIKRLYNDHALSIREIADGLNLSYGFVHRILDESNVVFKPRGGDRTRKRQPDLEAIVAGSEIEHLFKRARALPTRKKISPSERERMIAYYLRHPYFIQVAEHFNRDRNTVREVVKDYIPLEVDLDAEPANSALGEFITALRRLPPKRLMTTLLAAHNDGWRFVDLKKAAGFRSKGLVENRVLEARYTPSVNTIPIPPPPNRQRRRP